MRFLLELAGHLKIPSIRKLLAELDSRDFAYWRIMYRQLAFGSHHEDHRFGVVAAAAANAGRLVAQAQPNVRLSGQPFKASDFFGKRAGRPSKEELGLKLKLWARGMSDAN